MNETKQQLEGNTNGTLVEHHDEGKRDADNETATINSRRTSQSRDAHSKRRSIIFGDKSHKQHGSSLSIANSITTDDAHSHKHKKQLSRTASRDTAAVMYDDSHGQHAIRPQNGGPRQDRPSPASPTGRTGGWSTAPSVKEPRPTTGQNSVNSAKSPQTTPNSHPHGGTGGAGGGVRDSVMKRFSLLKGVGRKGSRLDFRTDANGMMVREE